MMSRIISIVSSGFQVAFDGRPADEVEKELENNLRSVKKARDDCAEEFARAERDFLQASQEHKAAVKASESINARRQTAVIELDAWLAGFAAQSGRNLDRPALQALLSRDDAWITAERTVLDALENATSKAEGALSVHKKAFEDHIAARPTIDDEAKIEADLVQLRSAQAELIRRRDAARPPLHADDQLQATRVSLARQLESRRSAFVPWEKLNELIGSADGAKFRSIAQRRTLDLLLRYANVQLNQIAGRYVLARVPESLNLVVLDRDMGEERRSKSETVAEYPCAWQTKERIPSKENPSASVTKLTPANRYFRSFDISASSSVADKLCASQELLALRDRIRCHGLIMTTCS
jgi:exonuclease SbcC